TLAPTALRRQAAADPDRDDHGQPGEHEPGAGDGEPLRSPQRYLLAGAAPLPRPDRPDPLQGQHLYGDAPADHERPPARLAARRSWSGRWPGAPTSATRTRSV